MKWPRNRKARRSRVSTDFRRPLPIESLEPRLYLAGDTYLVNFQLVATPIPTRYLPDTGQVFGDRGGGLSYGWSSPHTDVSRDRGIQADQRLDTLIHFHHNQDWELELPNGVYEVTVSIGDTSSMAAVTEPEVFALLMLAEAGLSLRHCQTPKRVPATHVRLKGVT